MRVVQLDFAEPSFPARIAERPDPPLPGPGWARLAVSGGGICGSDLHIFLPTTGPPTALYSYGTLPMELGHEIAGRVVEVGSDCPVPIGSRVVVDPLVTCAARGLDPVCRHCKDGAGSVCRRLGSGVATPGMGIGFTRGLGAGWGDTVLAHSTQLHALPDAVEAVGETLAEPLSVVIHGLLRVPPTDGPVLVVGAGVIGLLTTCALRALFPSLEVVVVAKHPHQRAAAEACGASAVVNLGGDLFTDLSALAKTAVRGGGPDAMLAGGFPYVVEAVGSEAAVGQALRSVDARGTVLLLGASGTSTIDLSPIWFKEATVTGSFCHAHDGDPADGDGTTPTHSFARAIAALAQGAVPWDVLVTHEFPLDDWRLALDAAMARDAGAIKVVLRP